MSEELKEMIVHDLVDRRSRSDIVQAVCERSGIDWPEAEELVSEVERERAHAIAARQTPMLVFLSACTSAGGVLLLAISLQAILPVLRAEPLGIVLGLAASEGPLALGVTGLAMIAGGVIGMHKTMLRYFET